MIGNVLKRQTTIIALCVIGLCIGVLGVSYAVFFKVDSSKTQVVTSGDLTIQFDTSTPAITTANLPQSAYEGQNNVYTFSVTNKGSLDMNYDIYIYNDPDAAGSGTPIPHEFLQVKLDNQEAKPLSEYALEPPDGNEATAKRQINLSDLIVKAKGAADQKDVATHNIRIWIDEDAPESIIGNIVALKVEVFGSAE